MAFEMIAETTHYQIHSQDCTRLRQGVSDFHYFLLVTTKKTRLTVCHLFADTWFNAAPASPQREHFRKRAQMLLDVMEHGTPEMQRREIERKRQEQAAAGGAIAEKPCSECIHSGDRLNVSAENPACPILKGPVRCWKAKHDFDADRIRQALEWSKPS
jgi:hypothetical protein